MKGFLEKAIRQREPDAAAGTLAAPLPASAAGDGAEINEEQRLMMQSVRDFMDREVLPRSEAIELGDREVLLELIRRAGELGITGMEVPQRHGGLGLDLTSSLLVTAEIARQASFSTSIGAHFGIGTLPLVLFGSERLKSRYLPELASAERIGAYALTETEAGSDALAVRSRAVSGEGGWVLDGEKQFITNAGIAGLYTVFAKVDGEAFTAFVVAAETPGVTAGPAEKKMGLRGSPTASVSFEGVEIPHHHVIGEVGAGHRVAFNILNVGRMKLAFGSLGYGREALRLAATHAAVRRQFGRPIGELELIREKLADMAARLFALEATALRTSRSVDRGLPDGLAEAAPEDAVRVLKAHAVESAIIKVLGSETVQKVADEALQIHGGYGFMEEYAISRIYRDVRVNRIFEGTSEINRLLIAGKFLQEAWKGDPAAKALLALGRKTAPEAGPGVPALIGQLRWVIGRCGGVAIKKLGRKAERHQIVLASLADLILALYALESTAGAMPAAGGGGRIGIDQALLELVVEWLRGLAIERVLRLGTRLDLGPCDQLVRSLSVGATDTGEAIDLVASAVLEGRL